VAIRLLTLLNDAGLHLETRSDADFCPRSLAADDGVVALTDGYLTGVSPARAGGGDLGRR
jgi:hypothetical protein